MRPVGIVRERHREFAAVYRERTAESPSNLLDPIMRERNVYPQ